eukprot:Skav234764  [mRNA]  locus=scaffold2396:8425:10814:- [translate_table: standard]
MTHLLHKDQQLLSGVPLWSCLGRRVGAMGKWFRGMTFTTHNTSMELSLVPQRSVESAFALARQDLSAVISRLRVLKLQKMVPEWSVPGEVWRQLVAPNKYYCRRRAGIGYDVQLSNTNFKQCVFTLLLSIRVYAIAPDEWCLNQTVQLDKSNGKTGCSALRTINVFEPLGKVHARTLWDRGSRTFFRDWAAGYTKHKSRVTPILQRRVVKHRLCAAGISHCDSFYDAANAFPSVLQQVCNFAIDNTCRQVDSALLKDRNNLAVLRICASDDIVFDKNGSGSLQGDTHAGEQFLEQYHPALDNFVQAMDLQFPTSSLSAVDPLRGCNVCVSMSTYADDLARTTICTSPADWQTQLAAANVTLSQVLGAIGVSQNVDKQEHVPCFVRQHAHEYTRKVFEENLLPGKTRRFARYLGSQHHATGNVSCELDVRVYKANIAWHTMGRMWYRNGACAQTFSLSHYQRLDKFVLAKGRRLMQGAACKKSTENGVTSYKALSNKEVWRWLRLAPSSIELCIRRLRYWQNVAQFPNERKKILAAVFGKFSCDSADTIDSDGRVAVWRPWLRQFRDDLEMLGGLDSGQSLLQSVGDRFFLVFSELRNEFLQIDASELRMQFLGVAIPPPGWSMPDADLQQDILVPEPDAIFTCTCTNDDGSICNKTFGSYVQLWAHMVHSRAGSHGERPVHALAAVTNACPWCKHKFASRPSAAHHINRAFCRGACGGRGSTFNPELLPLVTLDCPECQQSCTDVEALLGHIATHDNPAAFFQRQAGNADAQ